MRSVDCIAVETDVEDAMLQLMAVLTGLGGWVIVAIIFFWVEWNGGQAIVHSRVFPPYESLADMAAITLAFVVLLKALWREIASRLRG